MKEITGNPLHLKSLNHVSLLCNSLEESIRFYINTLGFVQVKRPGNLDFHGAWLFSYGIGIHLLQSEEPEKIVKKAEINPKDNHISFQVNTEHISCENMQVVEKRLKEMGIDYKRQRVEEDEIFVDQLFFHDPDGFMIEICNCDSLPMIPIPARETMVRSCSLIHVHETEEVVVTNTKVCSTMKS